MSALKQLLQLPEENGEIFQATILVPALVQSNFVTLAPTLLSANETEMVIACTSILESMCAHDGSFLLERKYHVFLSTGSISQAEFARQLCKRLLGNQVAVYLNLSSSEAGQIISQGVMSGLSNSTIFVPLISMESLANVVAISQDSVASEWTDPMMVEWATALELLDKEIISDILPIYLAEVKLDGARSSIIDDESLGKLAHISLPEKLRADCRRLLSVHIEYQTEDALDCSIIQSCTIKDVVDAILKFDAIDLSSCAPGEDAQIETPQQWCDLEIATCVDRIVQSVDSRTTADQSLASFASPGCLDVLLEIVVHGKHSVKRAAFDVLFTAAACNAKIVHELVQRVQNDTSSICLESLCQLLKENDEGDGEHWLEQRNAISKCFVAAGGVGVGLNLLSTQTGKICLLVFSLFEALVGGLITPIKTQHKDILTQSGAVEMALELLNSTQADADDDQCCGLSLLNLLMSDEHKLESGGRNLHHIAKLVASPLASATTKLQASKLLRRLATSYKTMQSLVGELSVLEHSVPTVVALCAIMHTGIFLQYVVSVERSARSTAPGFIAMFASPTAVSEESHRLELKEEVLYLKVDRVYNGYVRIRKRQMEQLGYLGAEDCWCATQQNNGLTLEDAVDKKMPLWGMMEKLIEEEDFVVLLLNVFSVDAMTTAVDIIHIFTRLHNQEIKNVPWKSVLKKFITTFSILGADKDGSILVNMLLLITALVSKEEEAFCNDLTSLGALPVLLSQALRCEEGEDADGVVVTLIQNILKVVIKYGLVADLVASLVSTLIDFEGTLEQLTGLQQLRIMFSSGDIKKAFVDAGGVDVLLVILDTQAETLHANARPIVDELASDSTHRRALITGGLMDVAVSMLLKGVSTGWLLELVQQLIIKDTENARIFSSAEGTATLVTMIRQTSSPKAQNLLRLLISRAVVEEYILGLVQQLATPETQLSALADLDVLYQVGNVKDELMATGGIEYLLKILNEPPTKQHAQLARSSLFATVRFALVQGDIFHDIILTPPRRLIRIFISSTITDTETERDMLLRDVFPPLRTYAASFGFELHVIDMRWGIRDESAATHNVLDLSLQEIDRCQDQSAGINFISLLGQKYGERPLPASIPVATFDKLLHVLPDDDREVRRQLMCSYVQDMNAVPAAYILDPTQFTHPSGSLDSPLKYIQKHSRISEQFAAIPHNIAASDVLPQIAIECRAVSAAFLLEFSKQKILPDFELVSRANMAAIEFLTNRISSGTDEEYDKIDLASRQASSFMTTRDVHLHVIKRDTDDLMCRYVELPGWGDGVDLASKMPYVGRAKYFVSHSWDSQWLKFVAAICEHSSRHEVPPYYWIDIFAVNQHWPKKVEAGDQLSTQGTVASQDCPGCSQDCPGCLAMAEDLPDWQQMQTSHDRGFGRVIQKTKHTLALMEPWANPRPVRRVWCIYEVYTTDEVGGTVEVLLDQSEQRDMQHVLQTEFTAIETRISAINAEEANVTMVSDRVNIFGAVKQRKGGFQALNSAIQTAMRRWLADTGRALLEEARRNRLPVQRALQYAAQKCLIERSLFQAQVAPLLTSAIEQETEAGMLRDSARNHKDSATWFHRTIEDVDNSNATSSKFVDAPDDMQAPQQLEELAARMRSKIKTGNVHVYGIKWCGPEGIDPENQASHQAYLNRLCSDVTTVVNASIEEAASNAARHPSSDALLGELQHHVIMCSVKARGVLGRSNVLTKLKNYVSDAASHAPLIVYGESGCGKTSIFALAAVDSCESIKNPHSGPCAVVVRFLGTSPMSTSAMVVMGSMCHQLHLLKAGRTTVPQDLVLPDKFDDRTRLFQSLMEDTATELGKVGQPLVIFLDSVDQLTDEDQGRDMRWIPSQLPTNCRLVISCIPDSEYYCFPAFRKMNLGENCFLKVPPIENVDSIFTQWLADRNRTVTDEQRHLVLDAYEGCPLPLYLKLLTDEAILWRSCQSKVEISPRLASDVRSAIFKLFDRMEEKHGSMLVRHAFGYITASRNGLSSAELEDILSCDEDVLDYVYQSWVPPIRRLPPSLCLRLISDVRSYLVERGSHNVRVLNWYHRQFWEAAQARFLPNVSARKAFHLALAEYFCGRWHETPKPTSAAGTKVEERHVAPQPLMYVQHSSQTVTSTQFNNRMIEEAPYHLLHSKSNQHPWVVDAFTSIVCTPRFVEALFAAGFGFDLASILSQAADSAANSDSPPALKLLLKGISRFVKSKAHILAKAPWKTIEQYLNYPDFVVGVVDRARFELGMDGLIDDAKLRAYQQDRAGLRIASTFYPSFVFCNMDKPQDLDPCLATLLGHEQCVLSVCSSPDNTRLASAGNDKSIRIWDALSGESVDSLPVPGAVQSLSFSGYNSGGWLVAAVNTELNVWELATAKSFKLVGHSGKINCATFFPVSLHIASASADCSVRVWVIEFDDGDCEASSVSSRCLLTLTGHTRPVLSVECADDELHLVTLATNEIKIWDISSLQKQGSADRGGIKFACISTVDVISGHVVSFIPGLKMVACGCMQEEKSLGAADPSRTAEPTSLPAEDSSADKISKKAYATQSSLCVIDIGSLLRDEGFDPSTACVAKLDGYTDKGVVSIACTQHKKLIAAFATGTIRSYDISKCIHDANSSHLQLNLLTYCTVVLSDHLQPLQSVCALRDNVVAAYSDASIRIWELAEKVSTKTGARVNKNLSSCAVSAFSPCGTTIAIGRSTLSGNVVEIWHTERLLTTGQHLGPDISGAEPEPESSTQDIVSKPISVLHHTIGVTCLCFSKTGRWLATAAGPKIFVWEVATASRVAVWEMERQADMISSLSFGEWRGAHWLTAVVGGISNFFHLVDV